MSLKITQISRLGRLHLACWLTVGGFVEILSTLISRDSWGHLLI
jgi:hypothetical protein